MCESGGREQLAARAAGGARAAQCAPVPRQHRAGPPGPLLCAYFCFCFVLQFPTIRCLLYKRHGGLLKLAVANKGNTTIRYECSNCMLVHTKLADIVHLLIVLNAAFREPSLCAVFPSHTARHYKFLRALHPQLLPPHLPVRDTNIVPV